MMQNEDWNRKPVEMSTVLNFIMKAVGIALVVIGIIFLFSVITEVWELFDNPEVVTDFATRFEKESGINTFTNSVVRVMFNKIDRIEKAIPRENQGDNEKPAKKEPMKLPLPEINVSYFAAWFFKIILLVIITRIALWMIREGSVIVRHDKENKALIASIAKEMCSNIFQETRPRI